MMPIMKKWIKIIEIIKKSLLIRAILIIILLSIIILGIGYFKIGKPDMTVSNGISGGNMGEKDLPEEKTTVAVKSSVSESPQEDNDVPSDSSLCQGILFHKGGDFEYYFQNQNLLPDFEDTFDDLIWLMIRGRIEKSVDNWTPDENALSVIKRADQILNLTNVKDKGDEALTHGGSQTWIRFTYNPYTPDAGVNDIPHKDIIVSTVKGNGEDAFVAVQDPKDLGTWDFTKLPGYGQWLDRELDIFMQSEAY